MKSRWTCNRSSIPDVISGHKRRTTARTGWGSHEPDLGRGILLIEDTFIIEETLMFDGTLFVLSRPDMEAELPGWLSPAIGPGAISAVRSTDEDEDEDLEDEDEDLEDGDDDDD